MQGHFLFDKQLVADCIAYYRDLDGRELTSDEAEQYLDSLADWYDWLNNTISVGLQENVDNIPPSMKSSEGAKPPCNGVEWGQLLRSSGGVVRASRGQPRTPSSKT